MECLVFTTFARLPVSAQLVEKTVFKVLTKEKRPGNISVHLIGDTKMRRLQAKHRGKKGTTDVLSFAAEEVAFPRPGTETELGDIFISIPKIKRQAKEWKVSFREEFNRMLIHGTLHILGYDHMEPGEAKIMFGKQEKYLATIL